MNKNACRYCGNYPGPVCDAYDCNMREGNEDIEAMEREELPKPELCANGRRFPGGNMDPDFYRFDMDDEEWNG